MSPPTEALQRISRLAPLPEILARVEALARPVPPRQLEPAAAVGATLAADISVTADWPSAPVAVRDGWAVAAELVADAGPYAPVLLSPPPVWVEAGRPMPQGTDAVLPLDAVVIGKTGAEAHAPAVAGDGVLPAGADAKKEMVLRHAGERLRAVDVAILRAAQVASVAVRVPRVLIFSTGVATRSRDDTIAPLIARAVESAGGLAQVAQASSLESALLTRDCDAVLTIGGTGTGRNDASVKTLARVGKVDIHGFGLAPGETAALGAADARPILMLPGRIDAALATFLVVGRELIARLAGRSDEDISATVELTKKVTSIVGLAEVVLVRRNDAGVEPLAAGSFPWSALAAADGWILVPPGSEGFPAGASVLVRPLP